MTGLPQALLARLGALALAFVLGVGAGAWLQASRSAATALQQAKADTAAVQATTVQATAAVAAVGADVAAIRANAAIVTERVRHAAPLIASQPAGAGSPRGVHAAVAAGLGAVGPGLRVPAAGGAGPVSDADMRGRTAEPAGPADDAGDSGAGGRGLVLSLAAVSLWNSALAGQVVPAGSCRADDPASAACAAASSASIEDAWVNHAANAAGCAEDRARYARLIDFLQRTSR